MKKLFKKKKILPLFLAVIIGVTMLSVSISAEASDSAEFIDSPTEDSDTYGEEHEVPESDTGEEVAINPFSDIYDALVLNSDKIFSLLAFIGTLIVGGAYKKGLIPSLTEALGKICSRIDEARADSKAYEGKSDEHLKNLSESITAIETTLSKSSELLSRLDGEMKGYSEIMDDHEKMRTLFSYQIDMLYSIFMSSALPEYQKEEIGLKISKMREELAAYEIHDE